MAKKVALDVLDIDLDHRIAEEAPAPDPGPAETPEAGPEPAPRRARWPLQAWLRRPRLWLLALAIVAVTAALVAFLCTGGRQAQEAAPAPAVRGLADVAPAAEPLIPLAGFLVHLTDERGAARLLLCDVALAPQEPAAARETPDWTAARNLIYVTLKGQRVGELLSPTGRQGLKEKLRDGLNALGKAPTITAVYFTALEVI